MSCMDAEVARLKDEGAENMDNQLRECDGHTKRALKVYIPIWKKSRHISMPLSLHLRFIAAYLTRKSSTSTLAVEPPAILRIIYQRAFSTSERASGRWLPNEYSICWGVIVEAWMIKYNTYREEIVTSKF